MEVSLESPLELDYSQASGVNTEEQMKMLGFDKDYNSYLNENCDKIHRRPKGKKRWNYFRIIVKHWKTYYVGYMTISRPCRHSLNVPVMLWTTIFLILLARGAYSREEQSRFRRFPKFEQGNDVQGGFVSPNIEETYKMMQFFRELLQRQRAIQDQLQVYNGEDLRDNQVDWSKIPLPLLNQMKSMMNDGSKEEEKRGSHMSLCHFKICNMG